MKKKYTRLNLKQDNFFMPGRIKELLFNSCKITLLNGQEIKAKFSGKIKQRSIRIRISDIVMVEVNLSKRNYGFRIMKKIYTTNKK